MGMLGRLFGTEKAISDLTDKDSGLLVKAGSWVGGLNYTDEEKAENNNKIRDWGLRQLEALAPFKVVQRILAFAAASFWIFVGLNVVASIWVHAVTSSDCVIDKPCGAIDARTDLLQFAMSDYVFWPVAIVFALYFSGGVINSLRSKGDGN